MTAFTRVYTACVCQGKHEESMIGVLLVWTNPSISLSNIYLAVGGGPVSVHNCQCP